MMIRLEGQWSGVCGVRFFCPTSKANCFRRVERRDPKSIELSGGSTVGEMHLFSQPTETGRRDIQSRYILMPVSMLVKCEKCGYENFPQHRFCGMCAAELRLPGPGGTQPAPPPPRPVPAPTVAPPRAVAVPKAREVVPRQVSGPQFLGIANEPAENRNVSYLLEDEPAPSHTGRNLVLLIVLAGAIAAGWHWRENLVSLVSRLSSNAAGSTQASSSAPAGSDSPSPTAPATGANASTPVGNQGAVGDTQTPAAQAQTSPPAAPTGGAAAGAADSAQSPEADQSQSAGQSQAGDSAGAAKNDESDETASQPAPKSRKGRVQPAPTPISRAEELEAEGEKYLYGNGVPENCTRARTSLLAAAQHSNAQAQNVLGTMYATGHCATRDLPTAYRWFSRSLRKDPNNTRIEQDLKVLWNQMTPEERQLALRDQR
jgi:hypothetical protein